MEITLTADDRAVQEHYTTQGARSDCLRSRSNSPRKVPDARAPHLHFRHFRDVFKCKNSGGLILHFGALLAVIFVMRI